MHLGLKEYVGNFFVATTLKSLLSPTFPNWLCRPQDGKVLDVFTRAQEFEENVTFLCLDLMLIPNKKQTNLA